MRNVLTYSSNVQCKILKYKTEKNPGIEIEIDSGGTFNIVLDLNSHIFKCDNKDYKNISRFKKEFTSILKSLKLNTIFNFEYSDNIIVIKIEYNTKKDHDLFRIFTTIEKFLFKFIKTNKSKCEKCI